MATEMNGEKRSSLRAPRAHAKVEARTESEASRAPADLSASDAPRSKPCTFGLRSPSSSTQE
jgi:hypothetical protein